MAHPSDARTTLARLIEITLTVQQDIRGARVGFSRRRNALELGLTSRHENSLIGFWASHAEGALAELAVSLALGLPWTGEHFLHGRDGYNPPVDVGTATEVRWSPPGSREPLLNLDAKKDKPASQYVLVVGFAPTYRLLGYIRGSDGRRNAWLVVYPEREVFRVPASELRPLEPGEPHDLV